MAGDVKQVTSTTAPPGIAPPEAADHDYYAEVVANAREIDEERASVLNAIYAELACRACGGEADDEESQAAIRQGWESYCTSPGGRCQDFDRLVLVWHGDEMVGFSGYVVQEIEGGITVLWYKAAGTDPGHQGHGAMGAARDAISDLNWLTSYGSPSWWVMRTPNPLVYDIARKWWAGHPDWYSRYYPKVTDDGDLGPIDEHAKEIGERIAKGMWPECEYDRDKLVLKDFLGEHGKDIWRVKAPISPQPGTQKFFEQNLRSNNEDAMMTFCEFIP
jgi:hypothetical protein